MYFRTEVTTYTCKAYEYVGVVMKTGNNEIDLRGEAQTRRKDNADNVSERIQLKGRA